MSYPLVQIGFKNMKLNTAQMELGFGPSTAIMPPDARRRRLSSAAWWFSRMRQVVDLAVDWEPAPEPRPEQTWLPGTRRESHLAPVVRAQVAVRPSPARDHTAESLALEQSLTAC